MTTSAINHDDNDDDVDEPAGLGSHEDAGTPSVGGGKSSMAAGGDDSGCGWSAVEQGSGATALPLPRHAGQSLTVYCRDCAELVCESCFIGRHNGHRAADVVDVATQLRDLLRHDADELAAVLSDHAHHINHLQVSTTDTQGGWDAARPQTHSHTHTHTHTHTPV